MNPRVAQMFAATYPGPQVGGGSLGRWSMVVRKQRVKER